MGLYYNNIFTFLSKSSNKNKSKSVVVCWSKKAMRLMWSSCDKAIVAVVIYRQVAGNCYIPHIQYWTRRRPSPRSSIWGYYYWFTARALTGSKSTPYPLSTRIGHAWEPGSCRLISSSRRPRSLESSLWKLYVLEAQIYTCTISKSENICPGVKYQKIPLSQ
jgi:hypothetical protein